ncbi:hypothetical protein FE391_07265 [Nonomuraea sp. KC401]|uniref:Uncharacterized protein n=1 Tax=Nonomuraea longispora TaxID=1848320 RepID=A0A4R4NLD8_9ACTN|nr:MULTISPECIES: hypothetical protein [Nonomuraea]NBE93778.1 hypothetical protein [Nonomuraea sp. K271]TDC10238.1 hypothetical protein E1267_05260 [Nonomuraea longispora]TLF80709.1 hypothetical protein FE391_07265 [Nonomuraea sp. KC401]
MDSGSVALLRELLADTGWIDRARELGLALRATRSPGGLLLVGPPDDEPWHLTAHLSDEARYSGLTQLTPTLVRWAPPSDAPAHLRVGFDRLERAARGETLFVLAEQQAPVPLLERVDDARRTGATILAIEGGDAELTGLAHDAIAVPRSGPVTFDGAQHLVSAAAGEVERRLGLRERLARLLDKVSGPQVTD